MIVRFATACVLLFFAASSGGAERPLFQDHTVLRAVLAAPISQAYAAKNQSVRLYLPGHWTFTTADGSTQKLEVSIRTRGKFRRENCSLPPLQLNFRKKQNNGTFFAGQDKLKLVSPCKSRPSDQQRLLLEYLAYRTLEIMTEHSLRTRLFRLTYIDTDERKKPWTHLVFLIETEEEMAERLGLDVIKVPGLERSQLDAERTELVEMFQYLIANTDYSVRAGPEGSNCCHNVQLLGAEGAQDGIIPVPYDFDWSGLVNAPYAVPSERLRIKDVRQRLYKGRCESAEMIEATIEKFQAKHAEIIQLYENLEQLDERFKKRALKFIDGFFKTLSDPKRVQRNILRRCLA